MNFGFIESLIRRVRQAGLKTGSLDILSDLLECETENETIKEILNLDFSDDQAIRMILKVKDVVKFKRLTAFCDRRKALRVILNTTKLEKEIWNQGLKSLSYPLFLFMISFLMLIFVDGMLLRTFSTLLRFMGPSMSFKLDQGILKSMIFLDLGLMFIVFMSWFMIISNQMKIYLYLNKYWPNNLWSRLVSHQFCAKFLQFYQWGSSIDEILKLIRESSDPVLAHWCMTIAEALEIGFPLSKAIGLVEPKLQVYFKMNEEGVDIGNHLRNHVRIQELLVKRQISKLSKIVLVYAYLKIAVIIVVIYQLMLKPIEIMENYL